MAKTKPVHVRKAEAKAKQTSSSPIQFAKIADWSHIIIITVLFWVVYSNIFDHKPDMNGDNFAYYLLGKRIATGQGFTNATDIHHAPHTHFPIGYPALLSVFIKVLGDDQDNINFMNGLMMFGTLLLLYFLVKRLTKSASLAFVAAFITALNSHLLRSSTITMSEIPFLFVSMLALFFFAKAMADEKGIKSPWLYLSVVCIAGCYYTKTTAIALLAGIFVYLLVGKDWKRLAVVVLGFGLLALPGYIRDKNLGSSHMGQLMQVNPYKPELGNLTSATFIERIQHNFVRYISTDIPSGVLSLEVTFEKAPISFWLLGIAIIGLALWGIYRLTDLRLVFLGYIGGTLAILMIWPDIWGGIRFILPLIPIAVFLALYGIKELVAIPVGQDKLTYAPYAFLMLGLLYTKPISALEDQANQIMPANYSNYFDIAKWAKANTPKDAIFSARKADMFIYYADRTCVGDKPSLDDKEVLQFFRDNKVDYVIIEQLGFSSTAKYLVPAVQKNPDKFEVVYQLKNPDTYLLKFKGGQ
jgi:hypothetical protein